MKIIGSVFILCASVVISYFYEKKQKSKINIISELCNFIKYIRSQIKYFSVPIDRIYEQYPNMTENISLIIDGKYVFSSEECSTAVSNFFASLGKGYKKEQLELCDYTIECLKEHEENLQAEYPNKIKVFRAISVFAGFCIVILLV